jgi:hypothetical protein
MGAQSPEHIRSIADYITARIQHDPTYRDKLTEDPRLGLMEAGFSESTIEEIVRALKSPAKPGEYAKNPLTGAFEPIDVEMRRAGSLGTVCRSFCASCGTGPKITWCVRCSGEA